MDDRQRQIREGAGLEESRLNVEFVDFLRKYGGIMMMAVAALALAYWGWGKYHLVRDRKIDEAFSQLEAAEASGSPTALVAVASDHPSMKGIADLARLDAADLYLASARSGLAPGAAIDPQTGKYAQTDLLTEDQKQRNLSDAAALYQSVVDAASSDPARVEHLISGLYGLAAVAESREKLDEARGYYDRILQTANANALDEETKRVQHRIDTLGQLSQLPRLYASADLAANKAALTPIPNPGAPAEGPFIDSPVPTAPMPPEYIPEAGAPSPQAPLVPVPAPQPANPTPAPPTAPPGR
jgi:hypothetical protein